MPSSRNDVQRALTSIYFHSRFTSANWLPEESRPLPLDRALEIIKGDDSRLGRSRRRRAIVKLYAAEGAIRT